MMKTPERIWHWGKANDNTGLPEWKNGNPTNDNGDQRVLNEPLTCGNFGS